MNRAGRVEKPGSIVLLNSGLLRLTFALAGNDSGWITILPK
jgi:hypothetical protein